MSTSKPMCLGNEFETRVQKWPPHRPLYRCTTCDRVFRTKRPHPAPHPNTRSHDRTMQSLFAFSDVLAQEFIIKGQHTECPACGTQDQVMEVDRATRWNTLHLSPDGKSATASTGDGDYEGEGFICMNCLTELAAPDDFEITDWT